VRLAAGAVYQGTDWPRRFQIGEIDLGQGKGKVQLLTYSDRERGFWTIDVTSYSKLMDGIYKFRVPGDLAPVRGRDEIEPLQDEGRPQRIFISYAREDSGSARELWQILNSIQGVEAWFDQESLLPGEQWKVAITKAIAASDHFILLVSSRSVVKSGFYQKEIRLALEVLSQQPPGKIFLIPARLDNSEPEFEELKELQYVDLFPDFQNGVDKIIRVLGTHRRTVLQSRILSISLRFTVHQARFVSKAKLYYFITVVNLSRSVIEVTHLWYEKSDYHIPVSPTSRRLPRRLEPSESWTSWLALDEIPVRYRKDSYDCFRLRLSDGTVAISTKEDTVPPYGSVPGGPIWEAG